MTTMDTAALVRKFQNKMMEFTEFVEENNGFVKFTVDRVVVWAKVTTEKWVIKGDDDEYLAKNHFKITAASDKDVFEELEKLDLTSRVWPW